MSALNRFLKTKSFSPNFSFKHFFRFSLPVHSTAMKIEKNAKFFISKFFDFWRRCTARRQKSEKMSSFCLCISLLMYLETPLVVHKFRLCVKGRCGTRWCWDDKVRKCKTKDSNKGVSQYLQPIRITLCRI